MLNTDDVHVWLTDASGIQDPALIGEYHALLNEAERRKHERYRLPKNRHESLVTRALVRTTLSRYCAGIEPADWRFVEVANGRPEVAAGQARLPLRFNVSRSEGLIACAVTLGRPVGVDVEAIDPGRNTAAIAERCFTATERQGLHAHHPERFYRFWTLKEAYVKARGLGLAIPLNGLTFDVDGPGPIRITFGPGLDDDPTRWQFALERPTGRHVLAVAVERGPRPDLSVRVRSTVPLRP